MRQVGPGLVVFSLLFLSPWVNARQEFVFDASALGLPAEAVDLSLINSGGQLPGLYNVTIWVGDRQVDSRDVEFRIVPAGMSGAPGVLTPCLTAEQLLRYGVDIQSNPELLLRDETKKNNQKSDACSRLSGLKGASAIFDFNQQKLQLIIPPDMLLPSTGEIAARALWDDGIPALLLNYQYNVQRTEIKGKYGNRNNQQYLQLGPGINAGAWRMRSTFSRQNPGSWTRLYSWAERRLERLGSQLTFGEQFFNGLGITEGVPFRGVQLVTDDDMLPYVQRSFSPVVEGVANTQARVEVAQNGYVLTSITVPAGPFRLSRLPSVASEGDLQVTVHESDGTRREFTVPYTSPAIAGYPGSLRYSLLAGQYRPSDSNVNTPGILSGEMLYGLPVGLTVYSGVMASSKYQSYTLGSGASLGYWGALSVDGTYSDSQQMHMPSRNGYRLRIRYSKSILTTGSYINFSTEHMSDGYRTLSGILDSWCKNSCRYLERGMRQRMTLNLSQGLGSRGRVGMNVTRQTWRPQGNTLTSWGGNYTVLLWRRASLSLNWTRSRRMVTNGRYDNENIISMMLSVPLGSKGMMSTLQMTHSGGKADWQVGLQGTALDNRLSWNVRERTGGSAGSSVSDSASLGWSGKYGDTTGYYSDSSSSRSYSLDTRGGMLLTRYGLTAGQTLGGTTALVAVPGVPGVGAGGWRGVKTDFRGYAIVSHLRPYMENTIEINPDPLNETAEPEYTTSSTIPTKGAVTYVPFPVRRGEKLLLTLTQHNGRPVPFGAVVTAGENRSTGIVDETGQVYLLGVDQQETALTVRWGREASESCTLRVKLSQHKKKASGIYRFSGICG